MGAHNDVERHLAAMSNPELVAAFKEATDDLVKAADGDDPEWHGACFAGALIYAQEMNKRGLTVATKH